MTADENPHAALGAIFAVAILATLISDRLARWILVPSVVQWNWRRRCRHPNVVCLSSTRPGGPTVWLRRLHRGVPLWRDASSLPGSYVDAMTSNNATVETAMTNCQGRADWVRAVRQGEDDALSHQEWPDRLTLTRSSGVDFYYEQYRRLLVREESLLKERDSLRRENVALRSRLSGNASLLHGKGKRASPVSLAS